MQMIKRLRATIFKEAYIDMGQARMNVDEAVYELVRQKLADASLCGPHTLAQTPPLSQAPPPPEKPSHRKRQAEQQQQPPPKRPRVEIFQVEEIIAEEPPSREVWHRYLVRWAGYRPEWETWRIPGRGEPGSPIESWETATRVSKYYKKALAAWEAQQQPAAASAASTSAPTA